jgi:hypothetical protein
VTLAGALATATDQALIEALQSLTKERRYKIRDLAQRLEPERLRELRKAYGQHGGQVAMAKLTPEQRRNRSRAAALKRWGKKP